ncbi:hypothetical protein HPB50_023218 [Hyalomma asiaticum]|uniref:Uncharacterized protein n=1 Tax=Hyalomma asiaticum TaxID=266040 RepID=A0ACB7SUL0_HYAAI|nr:hypothetical protein HPB50_023218 [Hyalomma asiaticum]
MVTLNPAHDIDRYPDPAGQDGPYGVPDNPRLDASLGDGPVSNMKKGSEEGVSITIYTHFAAPRATGESIRAGWQGVIAVSMGDRVRIRPISDSARCSDEAAEFVTPKTAAASGAVEFSLI